MGVTLQSLINGPFGLAFAMGLSRWMPPRLGYRMADALADRLAMQRQSTIVQAIRANQWVLSGKSMSAAQLDEAVRDTLRHTAHCLYDLYHHLHNPDALQSLVAFDTVVEARLAQLREEPRGVGTILVGPHLSNFDLVGRVMARQGLRAQVISFPQPGGGYRRQNDMRRRAGMHVTPASRQAIKQAVAHLRAGGVVVTGLDRPIEDGRHRPLFFGYPAAVPLIHITLAQRTGASIAVATAQMRPDGRYGAVVSEPIELQPHPNRRTELLTNAEAVLQVAEALIRQAPQHWLMFYPVWPDALADMP